MLLSPRNTKAILSLFLAASALPAQVRPNVSNNPRSSRTGDFDIRTLPGRRSARQVAGSHLILPKPGTAARSAGAEDAQAAARRFLMETPAAGLNAAAVSNLRLLQTGAMGQATVVNFEQTVQGVPVFDGLTKVVVGADGEFVSASVGPPPPALLEPPQAALSPADAVGAALRFTGEPTPVAMDSIETDIAPYGFRNPLDDTNNPVLVWPVAFPLDEQTARLGWRVLLDIGPGRAYEIVIDAGDGRLLYRQNRYRHAGSARVWKNSPNKGDRELVPLTDSWLPANSQVSTGSFADAYLDTNGDGRPDSTNTTGIQGGRAFSESQTFDFPAPDPKLPQDPRNFRAAAVTNAFYIVNLAHDFFYSLGFDEAAGNYQTDNGGKGGKGNDAIHVEVQNPFDMDNASFLPAPDGMPGRLELGIMSNGTQNRLDDRDLAYDGPTIVHEYSHGVTTRLVGAGSYTGCLDGVQSQALDEGTADYFSSSFFNDPVQSSYAGYNDAHGLRRQSYEGYTFTYQDLGNEGFEGHNDGEIWAATLWDLRKSLGAAAADSLIYQAVRLLPCGGTFVDGRDAVLAADKALSNGANRATIFTVFARHGLGASASGLDSGAESLTVFNAAFDLPPDLQPGNRNPVVTSEPVGMSFYGHPYEYQIQAMDPDGGTLQYRVLSGPSSVSVNASTGLVRWTPGFSSERILFEITDGQGGRVVHGIYLLPLTPLDLDSAVDISVSELFNAGVATVNVPAGTPILQLRLRGGMGDADLVLVFDPDGFPDFGDTRDGSTETMSFSNPTPGPWLVTVVPYTPFEHVQLSAVLPPPIKISGNGKLDGRSDVVSSETYYKVVVPTGATFLDFSLSGGTGDVDVVAAKGKAPICQVYEDSVSDRCYYDSTYASFMFGTTELIHIPFPAAGDWFFDLTAAFPYSGVSIKTAMGIPASLAASPVKLTFAAREALPLPGPQVISISDPSGSAFPWTAASSVPWLKLDKTSGTGDASISVSVDFSNVAPGNYTAAITITSAGLAGSPQMIPVDLSFAPARRTRR